MNSAEAESLSLALCGDVMTGRGVDQILPHPGNSVLHEDYARDAFDYVRLAVQANGPIPSPVACEYVWGDALTELHAADRRIVNLETSITRSNDHWPGKGIHYRMDPKNIGCLAAARIDCCGLANNHVLDWGYAGLTETLRTLDKAGIAHAGAGHDASEAASPAVLDVPGKGRVLVTVVGLPTSGIPPAWAAASGKAGVHFLAAPSTKAAERIAHDLLRITRPDDTTIVCIHWGGNWGYGIADAQIAFAHRLVDEGIDIVHGHSSHHPQALEIRRGRLILYGCGDFLNDYEGISGHEKFRGDLTLLYRIKITHRPRPLVELVLVPFQVARMQLKHASAADARWLADVLRGESARFGMEVRLQPDRTMVVSEG